jgi:hypothetical protein
MKRTSRIVTVVLSVFVLLGSSQMFAQNNKKSTSTAAPAKPAPATKPAPAVKPSGPTKPAGPANPTIDQHSKSPEVHPPVHQPPPHIEPAHVQAKLPKSVRQQTLSGGNSRQMRQDGSVRAIHDESRHMDVVHGLNGNRRVMVARPDGTRIFAERGRPGYVEHSFRLHDHDFARRSYFYRGHLYSRFYRPYSYRGVRLDVYVPNRYYPFGFYGSVYGRWGQVSYAWGWGGAPWAGYYGYYFAPSAFYPSASFWLTDYMLSQDLAGDYQAAQDSSGLGPAEAASGGPEVTADVKQRIANEVAGQIALEYNEAQQNAQNQNNPENLDPDPKSSSIDRLLGDGKTHVFVAGQDLDLVDTAGTECAVSGGDVLELAVPPPPDAAAADLIVLASKGGKECQKSDTVTVAYADLQEMQNHMRETVDQGFEELRTKQGTGGLPPAPASAQQPYTDTTVAQFAPAQDPSAGTEISQQMQQADAAEKEVTAQAGQAAGALAPVAPQAAPPAGTVNISVGQSIGEVTAAMGAPLRILNGQTKTIYVYKDMKITFQGGKVADVE